MEYNSTIKEFIHKINSQGPLLGIDYGRKRTGLSVSDPSRNFVHPIGTLINKSIEDLSSTIIELVKTKDISGIVIGYPLQLDGTEGKQCHEIKKFVDFLLKKLSIPIFLQDERFSSKEAQTMLRELNLKRKQRDKKDNEVAACNILQTTLNLLNTYKS